MNHTRGRPCHPQTQGKIERWYRSMKNQILLNHNRYHESIDNLTPADVYYGRGEAILTLRKRIRLNTIALRRKNHYDQPRSTTLMNLTIS